ncbi:MAG TPA: hypothetical protein VHB79_32080 [Polyangiaceae bacterium]|nr:hypothetical protein [Polyangiaceae bacterium]
MRAYGSVGAWLLLGGVALACSGTSFSEGPGGGGSGGSGDSSSGGVLNRGGRNTGGSFISKGGKDAGGTASGGTDAAGADAGGTESGGTGTGGDVSVGGDVVTAGTSSMGGSAGTNSGPPVDLVCPKNMPSNGALCKDGLMCSYGADLRVTCRNMAKCDGGKWTINRPNCEGLPTCGNGVKTDVLCDPQAPQCILDSSQLCVCSACGSSSGGACQVDTYKWVCAGGSGGPTCPVIPPNLGQACGGVESCPYGSCAAGNNVTASCTNQKWSWEQNPCPLATQ